MVSRKLEGTPPPRGLAGGRFSGPSLLSDSHSKQNRPQGSGWGNQNQGTWRPLSGKGSSTRAAGARSASTAFKPHPAQACSRGCSKREGRRGGTEKLNCSLNLSKVRSVLKKEPHINLGELSSLLPCARKHLLTPHICPLSLICIFPLALLTT